MERSEKSTVLSQIYRVRSELKNIRKVITNMKHQFIQNFQKIEEALYQNVQQHSQSINSSNGPLPESSQSTVASQEKDLKHTENDLFTLKPIGILRSLHRQKNGTPRQGAISTLSRGRLQIFKNVFNNPSHSLQGLEEYSHIWLFFIFHQNTSKGYHAKISPPRLRGTKVGVFASRSPHRPNPIGLTLAKLDKIENDVLMLSGIDLLDGTPVIDIKPFIPTYDSPATIGDICIRNCVEEDVSPNIDLEYVQYRDIKSRGFSSSENVIIKCLQNNKDDTFFKIEPENYCSVKSPASESDDKKARDNLTENDGNTSGSNFNATCPTWVKSSKGGLQVIFNRIAERQIKLFSSDASDSKFRLEYLKTNEELQAAISTVLSEDPRSTYRRHKCSDRLYFFMVDSAHVTSCFFGDVVEVLRVIPPDEVDPLLRERLSMV